MNPRYLRPLLGCFIGFGCLSVFAMPEREFAHLTAVMNQVGRSGNIEEVKKYYAQLEERTDLTETQRIKLLHAYSVACCFADAFKEALVAADKGLQKVPAENVLMRAMLLKTRGWALAELGRPEDAVAASREALALARSLKHPPSWLISLSLKQIGEVLITQGDSEQAIAAFEESFLLQPRMDTCAQIMAIRLKEGRAADACRAWLTASLSEDFDIHGFSELGCDLVKKLGELGNPLTPSELLTLRDEAMKYLVSSPETLYVVQGYMVDAVAQSGKFDAALFEVRLLFETCPVDKTYDSMLRVASILKSADENVARANAFLAYTKYGLPGKDGKIGTDDDLHNPLMRLQPADAEIRNDAFSKAVKELGNDWKGHLDRSLIYRYWLRYNDALVELQAAFRLAPVAERPLQTIMDATSQVLVQITGDPGIAGEYSAYQKFGVPGKDGKEGTDDDLADPVRKYLEKKEK